MTLRRSCSFSGISESNKSNGTLPTCATQIRARNTALSPRATSTSTGSPLASVSRRNGSPCGSSDG
ncbi:Uncharacterised protein [Mycobacterium tuberculosis]|nr:Uncharacterised protein [Mycobacterium tuberculosis]